MNILALIMLLVCVPVISRKTSSKTRQYPNDTFTSTENKGKTVFELPHCVVKSECVVSGCKRVVVDSFVTNEEVDELLEIARIGMTDSFDLGGPTILDINSGFVRDPSGNLRTLYDDEKTNPFSRKQYDLYRDVIERIRLEVQETFDISNLHFTAPTFITREIGSLENDWIPQHIHDEYWVRTTCVLYRFHTLQILIRLVYNNSTHTWTRTTLNITTTPDCCT